MRPFSAHFTKIVHASLLALVLACGRYEPGEYTSGGGTGQSGGSQSKGDANNDDEKDETVDCVADSDGSGTDLPFAIVEIGLGEEGFIEAANLADGSLYLFGTHIEGSQDQAIPRDVARRQRFLFDASLDASGELVLRGDEDAMLQYVCWGQHSPTPAQNEAITEGFWSSSLCVETPPSGQSLHLTGAGTSPSHWKARKPTPSKCP